MEYGRVSPFYIAKRIVNKFLLSRISFKMGGVSLQGAKSAKSPVFLRIPVPLASLAMDSRGDGNQRPVDGSRVRSVVH